MSDEKFTFAALRKAADLKYGSFDLEIEDGVVTKLKSPLRISDERRAHVKSLIKQLGALAEAEDDENDEGADDEAQGLYSDFLLTVGDEHTVKLLELIGDDLALLMTLFEQYQERMSLGEASTSSS